MTRKDYEKLAGALSSVFVNADPKTYVDISNAIAEVLKADNAKFDKARWDDAVYAVPLPITQTEYKQPYDASAQAICGQINKVLAVLEK